MNKYEHHHVPTNECQRAYEIFQPTNFGFSEYGNGWTKDIAGLGQTVFARLGWEHGHSESADNEGKSTLELLGEIQKIVFGMQDRQDIIPPHLLGSIDEMGGSVLVAYSEEKGFTQEGWLGFGLVFGGNGKKNISKFIGVKDEARGKGGIGLHLRLLQAHLMLAKGNDSIQWVHDPLNAAMAKLSMAKLGGTASTFTIEKYGNLDYALYGKIPTDRITVNWDLLSSNTHQKINTLSEGSNIEKSLEDIADLPIVNSATVEQTIKQLPPAVLYEIPPNLFELDEANKLAWKAEMRKVFSALLDTEKAYIPEDAKNNPALVKRMTTRGAYYISDFVTGLDMLNNRKNFYVFQRKPLQ